MIISIFYLIFVGLVGYAIGDTWMKLDKCMDKYLEDKK